MPTRPLIAVTAGVAEYRLRVPQVYLAAVQRAGGLAVAVGPDGEGGPDPRDIAARFDGFIFTGGDDPAMEAFGEPTHPRACIEDPGRQSFEVGLLVALAAEAPAKPVLGVCLGMQWMALVAGGGLNQHLPDDTPTAADHADNRPHAVTPERGVALLSAGSVSSRHHQAVRDPGSMRVVARAHDGVIEAIDEPRRPFYLGVQWHPERTPDPALGQAIFDRFIAAARIR